jgi:toxin HigB-1
MIKSFRHKGLKELFLKGYSSKVRQDQQSRCLKCLDILDHAQRVEDINVPGLNFHTLQGKPVRHTVHVNGPWYITFEWVAGDAFRANLEQYH